MRVMMSLRAARYISWLLISIVLVPYLSCGAFAAQKGKVPIQTVVLYPLDNTTGTDNEPVVAELDTFLQNGLVTNPNYRAVAYSERLPAVQRLLTMQPEKKSLTAGPFATDSAAIERAVTLGKSMSADLLVVGSVTKYAFDPNEGTALVTMTINVLDGKTGKTVRPETTITGAATKPSGSQSVSETAIRSEVVKDAGRKAIEEITGQAYQTPVQDDQAVTSNAKKSKKSWIPMLLLSLGVGLLLGGGGGGGGSSSSGDSGMDNPPPPPFVP